MNSSIPTQSASVLRNIGHSTSLLFARFRGRIPIMWKAIGIGVICAVSAFLYFLFAGSLNNRSVAEIGPAANATGIASAKSNQAHAKSTTETPVVVPPQRRAQHDAEFILSPSSEFQHIGPVSIRLKAAHPADKTCDLVLKISNGHEWNQIGRVNHPVPLVRGKRSTQLVITDISANSVSAYIGVVANNSR
jgi:hypothetical protein